MTADGRLSADAGPDGPIRVVIADDHPLIREGLRRTFAETRDIDVVAEAGTGAQTLELLDRHDPDVLLLDVRLPDTDGIALLRRLRQEGCTARVVILTCVTDEHCVRAAVDEGADGFLTKCSADRDTLVESVRNVNRGMSAMSPDALTQLVGNVREGVLEHLTCREREVWGLMAAGMSNGEIARALFVTERTVKFHVGNVLRKTHARTRAEAVGLAYRCGLMDGDA